MINSPIIPSKKFEFQKLSVSPSIRNRAVCSYGEKQWYTCNNLKHRQVNARWMARREAMRNGAPPLQESLRTYWPIPYTGLLVVFACKWENWLKNHVSWIWRELFRLGPVGNWSRCKNLVICDRTLFLQFRTDDNLVSTCCGRLYGCNTYMISA